MEPTDLNDAASASALASLAIARARVAALLPVSVPPATVCAFLRAVEGLHAAGWSGEPGGRRVKSRQPSGAGNAKVPHAQIIYPSSVNQMGGGEIKWQE